MISVGGPRFLLRTASELAQKHFVGSTFSGRRSYTTLDNSAESTQQPVVFEPQTSEYSGIIVGRFACKRNRNAFSRLMMKTLNDELDKLYENSSARVLILKSDIPGVFCAGADLKERLTMPNEEVDQFVGGLRVLLTRIADAPLPVIAVVEGAAFGGGLEMALACDIRIASPTATMGLLECRLGIIPGAGGTQRLPRVIGLAKAKELVFTGARVSGEEAARIGLVNHVDDDPFGKALELARDIIRAGPIAVRVAKSAMDRGNDVDLRQGLNVEGQHYEQVIWTSDRHEGMKAFLEKREPIFNGQ